MVFTEDLARLCDACGNPIGGGHSHCKKCNIYFCLLCALELIYKLNKFPDCPMCGKPLE